ncbi:MAG: carboxypeptidase-like regulatory domain-containing protein [Rikenellaceae bacterium]
MKRKNLFVSLALAAVSMMAIVSSCTKDEVTLVPEDVQDVIAKEYYIEGNVTTKDTPIEGVEVSIATTSNSTTTDKDGNYKLIVESAATQTISLSKDGYISLETKAVFADDAKVGTTVMLSSVLTAANEKVSVAEGETVSVNDGNSDDEVVKAIIEVPTGAFADLEESSDGVLDIAITYFTPSSISDALEAEGEIQSSTSLFAINCEPTGVVFSEPLEVIVPLSTTDGYFADVKHLKQSVSGGAWEEVADAQVSGDGYKFQLDGFSNHTIAPETTTTVTSSVITIASEVFDNINSSTAVTESFAYSANQGCEVASIASEEGSLKSQLEEMSLVELGANTASATSKELSTTINVAGDTKVTATATQTVKTYKFSAKVYQNGSSTAQTISTEITYYGSVSIDIETEQGDMRPDHNM